MTTKPKNDGHDQERIDAAIAKRGAESREHILSKDCWCNPTVEDYRE